MQILTKSRRLIKSTAITGSVAALLVTPGVAFAHGNSGGDDNGQHQSSGRSSQQVSQHSSDQAKQKQSKNSSHSWSEWHHKQERQKSCEERQAAVTNKATAYHDKYTKQLNGLNIVYSGTQTYAATVTVQDYDALKAETDASQAAATNAVGAITAPQLNCDGTQDQSQQDTDYNNAKTALDQSVKAGKDGLSAYRHDVFKLFNAAINS